MPVLGKGYPNKNPIIHTRLSEVALSLPPHPPANLEPFSKSCIAGWGGGGVEDPDLKTAKNLVVFTQSCLWMTEMR